MELKEYFDKYKEERDFAKNYVQEQYEKGYLAHDSVAYQSVNNVDGVGSSMCGEYLNTLVKLPDNKMVTKTDSGNNKTVTLHTDNIYMSRTAYNKGGVDYYMYDGLVNVGNGDEKDLRYVRCYSSPWDDKTVYDLMAVEVEKNKFYSSRIGVKSGNLEYSLKEEFYKQIEDTFNKEMENCEELVLDEEFTK